MSSILRAQNVDSWLYAKAATYLLLAKDKCTTYIVEAGQGLKIWRGKQKFISMKKFSSCHLRLQEPGRLWALESLSLWAFKPGKGKCPPSQTVPRALYKKWFYWYLTSVKNIKLLKKEIKDASLGESVLHVFIKLTSRFIIKFGPERIAFQEHSFSMS